LTPDTLNRAVRASLREHGRLAAQIDAIDDSFDLYKAGLSSHATVNLMLALEEAFDIEFPDAMLRRRVFESIGRITAAVNELVREREGVKLDG
jgi:acyl carrier protein